MLYPLSYGGGASAKCAARTSADPRLYGVFGEEAPGGYTSGLEHRSRSPTRQDPVVVMALFS